ncbi:MAG: phosphodiester glycosidase family protein [Cyclobacteriaceae bacterium]
MKLVRTLLFLLVILSSCVSLKTWEADQAKRASRDGVVSDSLGLLSAQAANIRQGVCLQIQLLDSLQKQFMVLNQNQLILQNGLSQVAKEKDSLVYDITMLEYQNGLLEKSIATCNAYSQDVVLENLILKDSLAAMAEQTPHQTNNHARRLTFGGNSYDTYLVDLRSIEISFFWKDSSNDKIRSLTALKDLVESAESEELVFATNAGMYTETNDPQGLYMENGQTLIPLDTASSGYGNFYLQPNGVFGLTHSGSAVVVPTAEWQDQDSISYATQSGPMLVIDREIHSVFTPNSSSKYIRSGVGLIDPHTLVFIISNEPVCFYDFASVFKAVFYCENALYLDGAISRMYIPQLNRQELGGDFGAMIGIISK